MERLLSAMKIVLGTTFMLYLKAHTFHWNVEGISFVSLHRLFGEIYNENWLAIDDIAEQIRQLDAYAPSTIERLVELSQVKTLNEVPGPREMLISLMADQETVMRSLTEALHAAEAEDRQGLANFLAGRLEAHSKQRWQLRASAKRAD